MNLIAAVDQDWGIGKQNQLLFHIPEDQQYFKDKTSGKIIVMGRSTLESLPGSKPLKNRINIVVSTHYPDNTQDLVVCRSLAQLARQLDNYPYHDIYICGGQDIYSQLRDYCTTAYITKVAACGQADRFFPNLDQLDHWKLVDRSPDQTAGSYTFSFCTYKNSAPRPLSALLQE